MRVTTLILMLLVFCQSQGQNSGFLGKRIIFKTDVVDGIRPGFRSFELEGVVGRHLTVVAGFNTFSYMPYPIKTYVGEVNPGGDPNVNVFSDHRRLSDGTTRGKYAYLGLRYYFDGIIPAPFGMYTELTAGYGKATFENYSVEYQYTNVDMFEPYTLDNVLYTGLSGESNFLVFDFPSFGAQYPLLRWLMLDVKGSLQSYSMKAPKAIAEHYPVNNLLRTNFGSAGYGDLAFGVSVKARLALTFF